MTARRPTLMLLALLALTAVPSVMVTAHAGTTCAPLQESMSYAQFRKLGLDKLSEAQLKGLNAWLQAHGHCGESMAQNDDRTHAQASGPATAPDGRIHSRIAGDFSGWEQGTVLTLQNGQRWRVTGDQPMHIATLHNPRVTVWKGLFNAWLLGVNGVDQTVHVMPAR